jgi:hypothetical protein
VVFLEDQARLLLIAHTVVAVAAIAASTHLVVWMRGYRRGEFSRHRAVRRFALISLALSAATFTLGHFAYPTYRTRVRAEYLDSPAVIAADLSARLSERSRLEPGPAVDRGAALRDRTLGAAKISRWFDVKEHWAGMAVAMNGFLALVLAFWHPRSDGDGVVPVVFGFALTAAAAMWAAGIIGLCTAAWRAV